MTQAGVSYQMKLLEERLGAPLFVRKGRCMVLTELGRRIAPRVTDAFTALGEAFDGGDVHSMPEEPLGFPAEPQERKPRLSGCVVDEQVYVAPKASVSARDRPEHPDVSDSESLP